MLPPSSQRLTDTACAGRLAPVELKLRGGTDYPVHALNCHSLYNVVLLEAFVYEKSENIY